MTPPATPPPPEGYESWLDWILRPWATLEDMETGKKILDDPQPPSYSAAREELRLLREREADLALMLRAALKDPDSMSGLLVRLRDEDMVKFEPTESSEDDIYIPLDGTGLPILTDAARAALSSERRAIEGKE